ncbi:hypothetical protein [Streptomyces sp. NPDC086787]|uniref:hypothetical protein n=1 Tax=Streptomyces sp. NPDC086787 TaxID=3365759 RepID=UPI0037F3E896
MLSTAEHLLSALEPLAFPERLTLTARTARALADDGRLAPLLADLDAGGTYERRLGALAALAGGDTGFLTERLADPDRVVAGYALRAARPAAVPDATVEAAYEDAPAALRGNLARLLLSGGRTELAERLVVRLRDQWGDAEAARLLPACSTAFVARELPDLAHAVDGWTRLARRHPDPVLGHAETALADRVTGHQRQEWWRVHATTAAALAPSRPEGLLALLEGYGPDTLTPPLVRALGPLVATDAERVVRWLTSPERSPSRHEPCPPPGVLRALVRAAPESLPVLGWHWLRRSHHFAALLKAMAPGRRPAFLDAVTAFGSPQGAAPTVLELLPRERRWAEVRREAAEFTGEPHNWWDETDTLAHGPFAEARPVLLDAVRRSDADDRACAWRFLVQCAGRDGSRTAITATLAAAARLRNDQDLVRREALDALAEAHPRVFAAEDAAPLDRIAGDALEARDVSDQSLVALRSLAVRVLVEHVTDDDEHGAGEATALRDWALRTMERITGRVGVPDLGPLHRVLRRGQERQVFEALRPWLDAGARRADFRLLLALAAALGPRARRLPGLQDMLVRALEHGDDPTFEAAAALWLAAPATRGERVARIIALEPSAVVLGPVLRVLTRWRTDLLDPLLDDTPPYGRFLARGARRPLPDLEDSGRWLPRQRRAAAGLAARAAADHSLPLDDRAALIRAAAPVPELGFALALQHADASDVVLAEAALGALSWTDRPEEALPVLLRHAGGDRARVAGHAAARAARFTAPSRLAVSLAGLLTAGQPAKVTTRKEAARLAVRFLPSRQASALLADAFHAADSHPDVRTAVVRALPPLLGEPASRSLLADAARDDAQSVRGALMEVSPWEVAEAHRRAYASAVGTAYDTSLALDGSLGHSMTLGAGQWCRYEPELRLRLSRAVCDLDDRTGWNHAASALSALLGSGLPHPLGGAAPGSVFHGAVAGLLAALHTSDGGRDALHDRDLPALQRLRALVSRVDGSAVPPELLEAVIAQLAPEPLLAAERAVLQTELLNRTTNPSELHPRLRELADMLEGAGVLAAVRISGRLWAVRTHFALPGYSAAVLAAAERLARDGGTAAGLLATGLVTPTGAFLDWPEAWRSLLRLLRAHPHPDVRHQAHQTVTARE